MFFRMSGWVWYLELISVSKSPDRQPYLSDRLDMDYFARKTYPPYYISGCVYLSDDCKQHWKMVMTMYGYCLQVIHLKKVNSTGWNTKQAYEICSTYHAMTMSYWVKFYSAFFSSSRGNRVTQQPQSAGSTTYQCRSERTIRIGRQAGKVIWMDLLSFTGLWLPNLK